MCGIAGMVSTSGSVDTDVVRRMTDALIHRGPDNHGYWSDGYCALGHRRLSIIDLSPAGRQPMANSDGSLQITFNGEIYNFRQLRRQLEAEGYVFRTLTDTEAILHAYDRWGDACVSRLRGMFAFGLWDARRKRLLLARDRVGKKPLFYARVGETLFFASEIQALLTVRDISRDVNYSAIDTYLSYGYIQAPQTGFTHINKIQPGHILSFTADKCEVKIDRYWSIEYQPKLKINEQDACEALREKLTEAVRLRMISDVPLGAFLSGGIDSSIVVGLMAGLSTAPVKTFSIGFREAAFDETAHARRIAEKWGTDHHEFIVEPDASSIIPMLVRHYGEPYADSSAIPTFYVAQITRRHVTVALNGDGGDESFVGYERYLANEMAARIQAVPGVAAMAGALHHLIPDSVNPKSNLRRARRFLSVASMPMAERYGRWLTFFTPEEKESLYSPEFKRTISGHEDGLYSNLFAEFETLGPIDGAMAADVAAYLPYDLLVKVDITSMANSLEARSPFLDHEVMELAARLPVNLKYKDRQLKYLLKKAFADLLPSENVNRRKMGFGVPVGDWFRGPLKELLLDSLTGSDARTHDLLRTENVQCLVDDHVSGRRDNAFKLWNLLMLELWLRG
ncbi:MAG: asparagine synthase (glutamine-hydrolyzing) [Blastocatellales bacterium]